MTDTFTPQEERDLVAAEYVLGLLEGEALMSARGRAATEPAFAAAVAQWEARLEPLFEGFAEVAPPAHLWESIKRSLDSQEAAGSSVVPLQSRERLWRGWAVAMTAVAAGLALVLALGVAQPDPPPSAPPAEQRAPTLFASLASEDGRAALAVAFEPGRDTMVVTPARLLAATGRDHELWLIAGEGAAPVSLGIVRGPTPRRMPVPAALRGAVAPEATVALSVEPTGGSPTGSPTGPVIASGSVTRV
ncbi:MAG TPA: anti-sigma factor [Allosphingosinicella sp.]|jgi:anti-sigma-K factor RskA